MIGNNRFIVVLQGLPGIKGSEALSTALPESYRRKLQMANGSLRGSHLPGVFPVDEPPAS
jgi:hypothetical protein